MVLASVRMPRAPRSLPQQAALRSCSGRASGQPCFPLRILILRLQKRGSTTREGRGVLRSLLVRSGAEITSIYDKLRSKVFALCLLGPEIGCPNRTRETL